MRVALHGIYLATTVVSFFVGTLNVVADGCFVFHWDKQRDINEPTQKAIILYDQGQEDMVLQVKYEGPAEDFGWLIPVPGLPEVRKGSMDCFYELSRLTQRLWGPFERTSSKGLTLGRGVDKDADVKVIKVKTVGAYEVAVLSTTNATALSEWLEAHHFAFPKEKQDVLDGYIKKKWYFVAAKIDPSQDEFVFHHWSGKKESDRGAISSSTRKQLANGELHPLVISFSSEKCVFPLAISAINGKPSEVSLYVLSSEPLVRRAVFDKCFAAYSRERAAWIGQAPERQKAQEDALKRREEMRGDAMEHRRTPGGGLARFSQRVDDDPSDPMPSFAVMRTLTGREDLLNRIRAPSEDEYLGGSDIVQSTPVDSNDIPACAKEMPRLAGKSWWLAKDVEVFAPENMHDLEFEPAIPMLAAKLGTHEGRGTAACLSQFGPLAIPAVLSGLNSSSPLERQNAAFGATFPISLLVDSRLEAVVPNLLADADSQVRRVGCELAKINWDAAFTPRLEELLGDTNEAVRSEASDCLRRHREAVQVPVLMKMVAEDGVAASSAVGLIEEFFTRDQLDHLFISTNPPVVSAALSCLRNQYPTVNEIEPLITNSVAAIRMMGLRALFKIGDKAAVDRLMGMLHDPNEGVRWHVRNRLRRLTGQKLGLDPAAWEKWWAENKKDFTP